MSEPTITLAQIIAKQKAAPRTVELELAIQDFHELSLPEQLEVLFIGLVQIGAQTDWCMKKLSER